MPHYTTSTPAKSINVYINVPDEDFRIMQCNTLTYYQVKPLLGNKAIHIYNGNPRLDQATAKTCCELLDIPFIYLKCEWKEMEMPFLDCSMSLGDDMVLDPDTIVDDVTMAITRPEGKGLLTACFNVNGLDVRGRMDELRLLLVQQTL